MVRTHQNEPEPLLIDRAAAAEIPSEENIREWAGERRVFISSVMSELATERQRAAAAVQSVGALPVMFELFGGREADPEQAYLAELETSDIYLGILGRRYGKPLASRFSATHSEYIHAEKRGLRIAVWAVKANDREGHEQSFLDEIRVFHVAPEFSSPDDLEAQVKDRLRTIAAEDLAPWCKLANVVFRAREVADRGNELSVVARVRSDEVAHALERLRGDLGRGHKARFTWAGRSKYVSVKTVESTTTSARSQTLRVTMGVMEPPRDYNVQMTVNGLTPTDLTEAALRTAFFSEPNRLVAEHLGFLAEIPDPLRPLRDANLSEETVRPLSELLIVEVLVGTERASRITQFKLGVAVRGVRLLTLSWEPQVQYSGERSVVRTITGQIRL
jgi:hypothetical protein